ncbi:MAG: DEAD/DEAH box helicase [Alphaproteobacteria bacterium]
MQFKDLGLSDVTIATTAAVGYDKPTPIQAQVIPHILQGRDVFGCAQTGTGKTASFTLPMIDLLSSGRARARMPRSLILIPTRELAAQVVENFQNYSKLTKLKHALLIGGESPVEQQKTLQKGVDVLIATPGRLLDLFDRGHILLNDIKLIVIDEADRMLDMGFIPDVEKLFSIVKHKKQTLLFSATMPKEIKRLANTFLKDPVEVIVSPPTQTATTITQYVIPTSDKDKRGTLKDILGKEELKHTIIFCNRKKDATNLCISLKRSKFNCGTLHGDLTQTKRTETLEAYRNGDINILVASDVAARGLDIDSISHVFNYNVPQNAEDYIHRIGRTGRAGQEGKAMTFLTPDEQEQWNAIVSSTKSAIIDYTTGEPFTAGKAPAKGKQQRKKAAPKPRNDKAATPKTTSKQPEKKPAQELPKVPTNPVKGFGENVPAFFNIAAAKK